MIRPGCGIGKKYLCEGEDLCAGDGKKLKGMDQRQYTGARSSTIRAPENTGNGAHRE
jgi:hypothetical protein